MVLLNSVVTMVAGISLILLVPGPTNSLLLVSGLKKGVLKSSPLIIAEACGYITAIGFWAVLLSTITKNIPSFPEIAKAACSIYIFFLAIKIWSFGQLSQSNNNISFSHMVIASAINPKALLFVTLLIPKNFLSSFNGFLLFVILFILVMVPIGFMWVSLGGVIKKASSQDVMTLCYKTVSIVLMTLGCILFYTAFE
ncbi:LysE family translocator [Dickeya zeae]|uniref:LysE family translocator n=1 Tax=Dickeya zeae TaxID=204042 RepID=UPI00036D9380|nr:hypothetical protein [Dickeya zeae]AJC65845.1 translocator protein, LysE family [Dickeya zeae EC1]